MVFVEYAFVYRLSTLPISYPYGGADHFLVNRMILNIHEFYVFLFRVSHNQVYDVSNQMMLRGTDHGDGRILFSTLPWYGESRN